MMDPDFYNRGGGIRGGRIWRPFFLNSVALFFKCLLCCSACTPSLRFVIHDTKQPDRLTIASQKINLCQLLPSPLPGNKSSLKKWQCRHEGGHLPTPWNRQGRQYPSRTTKQTFPHNSTNSLSPYPSLPFLSLTLPLKNGVQDVTFGKLFFSKADMMRVYAF